LSAHALRALGAWRRELKNQSIEGAIHRGCQFLSRSQRPDGSWIPLWFGNQDHPAEENPVYGTAKVLLAYRDFQRLETQPAARGLEWLKLHQNPDGGWGGSPAGGEKGATTNHSSVEETALAVEALLAADHDESLQAVVAKGLDWLVQAVETNTHYEASPIGFYFAKLWYHERLYPLTFTVSALGQAVRHLIPQTKPKPAKPATARLTNA
jgi:squalene-hopene/tetraprenyl-beta-curcumene cyclase